MCEIWIPYFQHKEKGPPTHSAFSVNEFLFAEFFYYLIWRAGNVLGVLDTPAQMQMHMVFTHFEPTQDIPFTDLTTVGNHCRSII